MKTILCIGDSNTYGFSPRTGGRYPTDKIWASGIENAQRKIINRGVNGKCVPAGTEINERIAQISQYQPDAVIIMLGTNDLLSGISAEKVSTKMDAFLSAVSDISCILIAPPVLREGTWVENESMIEESEKLSSLYAELAEKYQFRFADSALWNPEIDFDGVHLTVQGHALFKEKISELLASLSL